MTLEEAQKIYVAAGGEMWHLEEEWDAIHREMEEVVAAKTDSAAGSLIQWWRCWNRCYTAIAFARRVREAYAKMGGKA